MQKSFALCLVVGLIAFVRADEDPKPELKPYGFLKGDMYFSTDGLNSWGSGSIVAAARATGSDETAYALSAQHSRFGLKGSAPVGNMQIGGVLELDFFSTKSLTNANANPRIRLGYAWIELIKGLQLRFGQQWDLFSPLNPSTNNTNANLWYNGNYGFRRPQVQFRYLMDFVAVKPIVQISVGEGAKEGETDVSPGADNLSMLPMIQGRVGLGFAESMSAGFSGFYTAFGEDQDYSANGISVDVNLPIHDLFAFKGEFGYGGGMNHANIFTIGPPDSDIIGFWANVISKPLDFLHIIVGFADEMNITEDLADGQEESNLTVFGNLTFPFGKYFSIAAEYQFISTTVKGQDAFTGGVIDIAAKISF
ncbi:MAG: hypothetical protein GF398_06450 [Chitinivibrionales bacterium]|nr:hypothetical protein [Chitinivibrionales bacterium]